MKLDVAVKNHWQVGAVLIAFLALWFLQNENDFHSQRKGVRIAAPAEIFQHLVLGYKNVAADLLWLRVIQELDYKESETVSQGWVFQMLDNITTLEPRFRMAYAAGTSVLSVVVGDVKGAAIIYERGIENFPQDWKIAYRAAYHYLYEVQNCKRAAELLMQSVQNGGPSWLAMLASRLYSTQNQQALAILTLKEGLEKFRGTPWEPYYEKRLKEVQDPETAKNLTKAAIPCR